MSFLKECSAVNQLIDYKRHGTVDILFHEFRQKLLRNARKQAKMCSHVPEHRKKD